LVAQRLQNKTATVTSFMIIKCSSISLQTHLFQTFSKPVLTSSARISII